MEDTYESLAQRLLGTLEGLPAGAQYMVAVAGGPGAGKSTLTKEVCRRVDRSAGAGTCVVVPMDGYHYTRARLAEFDDPAAAAARRGAHWTFDGAAFVGALRALRATHAAALPAFDHAVGDPAPDAIHVAPSHRLVLVEGNYLLLDIPPWDEIAGLVNERWYISCELDAQCARVMARHISTGSAADVAASRVAGNDRPNAELVAQHTARADLIIQSLSATESKLGYNAETFADGSVLFKF